jgi:hypothetical protein
MSLAGTWSLPVRVMFAPHIEYRALVSDDVRASWLRALRGPAFTALLIGGLSAIAATGRITASLIVSGAICWSFVPRLQIATAAPFALRSVPATIARPRALELWFVASGPWSLWIFIALAVLTTTTASQTWVVVTAILPGLWTAWLLTAFFREVLRLPAASAIRRTIAHQALTWGLILTFIEVMTATFTRVLGVLGR